MTINFSAPLKDRKLIEQIARRYKDIREGELGWETDLLDVVMDVTATHMNGCPLKLKQLLETDKFQFMHDVAGIREHLNRSTGQLDNRFVPRSAK